MAFDGINDYEHGQVLWKIASLPFEESGETNKMVNELYRRYQKQLQELQKTVSEYNTIAAKIKGKPKR